MAEQQRAVGPVVGIDLGTTNSLIAFMQGDAPAVIPGEDGSPIVPSVVAFDQDTAQGFAVGNAARSVLLTNAANAVYSVKRLMGRDLADVEPELKLFPFHLAPGLQPGEVLKLNVGGLTLTPPEISAYILLQLKRNAERFFGAEVTKAVITVPAYFNDAQRQATKTLVALPASTSSASSTSPPPPPSPMASTKIKTASSLSTTSAAAPSTSPSSSSTKASSKSSPPAATPISAATTSTTSSPPSLSTTSRATSASTSPKTPKSFNSFAKPSSTRKSP